MDHQQRWQTEQQFFDDEEYNEAPIPQSTIERYTHCKKAWLAPEFPFYVLGDLRGKYVLELGCGDGGNAILMALRGARVVGVDISPKAIEIAKNRAAAHGVTAQTSFTAQPLETYIPPDGRKFDIVCGWAVLHHVIPVLDSTMATLAAISEPNAFYMFSEPVSLLRWLRRLRLFLPIPTHGTPDERPLEPAELDVLRKYIPQLQARYHNAAVRIVNKFFVRGRYEDFSPLARAAYDTVARVDEFSLNYLGLSGFASSAVLYGSASPHVSTREPVVAGRG